MKVQGNATLQGTLPGANIKALEGAYAYAIAKSKQRKIDVQKSAHFHKQIGEVMKESLSKPGRGCYTREIPFV